MLTQSEIQNRRLKEIEAIKINRTRHKTFVNAINNIINVEPVEEMGKLTLLQDDTNDNDKDGKTLQKLKNNIQSMTNDTTIFETTYNGLKNNLTMHQINQVVTLWTDIAKKAKDYFPNGLKPRAFGDFIIQYLNKYNNVNTVNTKMITNAPEIPKSNKKRPPLIKTPVKRRLFDDIPPKSPMVDDITENNEYIEKRSNLIKNIVASNKEINAKIKKAEKLPFTASVKTEQSRKTRIAKFKTDIEANNNKLNAIKNTTNADQLNNLNTNITGKGLKKKKQIIYGRGYDIPNNDIHIINNKYELNMKALNNGTLKLRYARGGKNSLMPITYGLHKSVINTIVHLLEEKFDRNVFNSMSQKDKDLIIKFCDILHYNIGMTVNKKDALEEQINIYIGEYLAGNVSIKPHLIKKIKEAMDKNMITSKNANAILNQIN